MPITALPLDPGAQARVLLHHLLEAGDIIGRDAAGRTVIQLAADDRLLDQLMTFDTGAEDLEDGGDAEDDGPAVLSFDRVPAKRARALGRSDHGVSFGRSRIVSAFGGGLP